MLSVVLLCAACTGSSDDTPPPQVAKFSAPDALNESTVDLKGAGALRYNGSLTAPAGDKVTLDVTVTKAGESSGQLTVNGLPANILVLDHTLYLKGGVDFWLKLSGVPDSTAPIIADRWTKTPGVLLGVDVERIFDTDALAALFGKPVGDGKKTTIAGTEVYEVETDAGSVFLSAQAPYGIVRFDLNKTGKTDPTKVHDLAFNVSDATSDMAAVYRDLATKAAELDGAYDPFIGVKQGEYKFENCSAASCAIVVDLTNIGRSAARVAIKATWKGEGAQIGSCEARTDVLQPGQSGNATCTLASPEWNKFFRRAQSVPGQHPYGAEWTAMALVTPPDPAGLRTLASSAETPVANPQGDEHVFVLRDDAGSSDKQIWKYGVASGNDWRKAADDQLKYCQASKGVKCAVDQVATTGDPASAHALARQLVDAYKGRTGACPSGQWVGCARK
ncbi:hypothetical protein [Actinocrispum sp. NPDC049592]|uniref:hypothetical protein n=1 Tax=Actinocrispum sp. NPDC049592 TaxID=3154835 RepID=UPI00342ABB63